MIKQTFEKVVGVGDVEMEESVLNERGRDYLKTRSASDANAYLTYATRASFFWRSKLTASRRDKILQWVAALTDEEKSMLEDLLKDTKDQADFDAAQQEVLI